MTAKEMFEKLGYEQITNNDNLIKYKNDSLGDGDYTYVSFNRIYTEYEVGYYDGYNKTRNPLWVSIQEYKAITKQLKELGWIWAKQFMMK